MQSNLRFGAVADDFTGGSDLAGMLHERGVRTVLSFGVPRTEDSTLWSNYDAAVVCLKIRSADPALAVRESVDTARSLRAAGVPLLQYKYCSTFDSTARGNIGPITAALLEALGADFTVAVPALPVNGRTQYLGHLFVNGELLSDSPLRHHPLNPMTDSNLVRHLQAQTAHKVGLIDLPTVRRGPAAVRERAGELQHKGVAIALVDAIGDQDLDVIAAAVADMPLITGGSGLAGALPAHWSLRPAETGEAKALPIPGPVLILSGSCSAATLTQLRDLQDAGAAHSFGFDFDALAADPVREQNRLTTVAEETLRRGESVCIHSTADAESRGATFERLRRARLPVQEISERLEATFAAIAGSLLRAGVTRKIVVAGGETAGAVVSALRTGPMQVTSVIDPGVPALLTLQGEPVQLALKSGNFGSDDFFRKTIGQWAA